MKESQIAVMDEFVDNVKTLISALGYKVLEPLNKPAVNLSTPCLNNLIAMVIGIITLQSVVLQKYLKN